MSQKHPTRKKPKQSANPLIAGLAAFILQHFPEHFKDGGDAACEPGQHNVLTSSDLPKRFTVYTPMLLLGPTFETHSKPWRDFLAGLDSQKKELMCQSVLDAFASNGHSLTHIAINAPILAELDGQGQNAIRSPINLKPFYGDFGPAQTQKQEGAALRSIVDVVGQEDFEQAFWVSHQQSKGITQVWAPRWTMFSRGNIREKTRIIGAMDSAWFPGTATNELGEQISSIDVVDFYVGIGYFAFSYLQSGVRRVFGWDINGWSIEGLRRGCEKNGWKCLVVVLPDEQAKTPARAAEQVVKSLQKDPDTRCVAFLGDNRHAVEVMGLVSSALEGSNAKPNIRHCNLGLLPTSQPAWHSSARVLSSKRGGWLHVHENAEITRVDDKRAEVIGSLQRLLPGSGKAGWAVACEQTEMVKTYAPGIGHYVFDIRLAPTG